MCYKIREINLECKEKAAGIFVFIRTIAYLCNHVVEAVQSSAWKSRQHDVGVQSPA